VLDGACSNGSERLAANYSIGDPLPSKEVLSCTHQDGDLQALCRWLAILERLSWRYREVLCGTTPDNKNSRFAGTFFDF
jgi:hypothetical protein